jgi:ribosome-binding factor A
MSLRQTRLADQIRDMLGQMLMGGVISDPRLQAVAVTAVKLTADLQLASVYFRCFGEAKVEDVKTGLDSAAGFLRNQLARELDLRRAPQLRFFFDESVEKGERIEKVFINLKDEKGK